MSAVQRLYAVADVADPFSIPPPPASAYCFVELHDREFTFVVYAGDPPQTRLLGYVRHDPDNSCRWAARTTGLAVAAADIRRNFVTRDRAAEWLAGGVVRRWRVAP